MEIGVLGANGFLGRSLCSEYLEDNHNVYAFYNENTSLIPEGCVFIPMNNVPDVKLDCLVISIGGFDSNYDQFLHQNILIHSLLKKIKFKRVLFVSSVEVYGSHADTIKISSPFNNPGRYGLAKLAQEFLIKSCESFAIIRPTYLYGVGMKANSLIPKWVDNATNKKAITIFGDGKRRQDYLHVKDFTSLCKIVSFSDINDTLIAATGISVSNLEIAELLVNNIEGCKINHKGIDNSVSYRYDIEHTRQQYGWEPQVTIQEGLRDYINHENFNI